MGNAGKLKRRRGDVGRLAYRLGLYRSWTHANLLSITNLTSRLYHVWSIAVVMVRYLGFMAPMLTNLSLGIHEQRIRSG